MFLLGYYPVQILSSKYGILSIQNVMALMFSVSVTRCGFVQLPDLYEMSTYLPKCDKVKWIQGRFVKQ